MIDTARVALLVTEHGYTQQQFADLLSYAAKAKKPIHLSTVSAWFNGRNVMPTKYVPALTELFDVSADYLLGNTDERKGEGKDPDTEEGPVRTRLRKSDLPNYHGRPVWVEFRNFIGVNGWAIYDADGDQLIMKDRIYHSVNLTQMDLYPNEPGYTVYEPYRGRKHVVSAVSAMSADAVYIEVDSPFTELRKIYNGWYRHNETKTAFINEKGLVLPYAGLNVTYRVVDIITDENQA